VSEEVFRPQESLGPLPDPDHRCSQDAYVRSSTVTPHCTQAEPRGLPSPPPHKKGPLHLKITFQSPFCSKVKEQHSMGLGSRCRKAGKAGQGADAGDGRRVGDGGPVRGTARSAGKGCS